MRYLNLEAQKRNLITHDTDGFKIQKTLENLNINEDYEIIIVIDVGKLSNKEKLEKKFKKRRIPPIPIRSTTKST